MNAVQAVPVQVETHGRVPGGMRELAAAKASSAAGETTRAGDRYGLAQVRPDPDRLAALPEAFTLSEHPAPGLTVAEAIGRLDWLGRPFVFFVDPETCRAGLLYHRYDGHYGLVAPER